MKLEMVQMMANVPTGESVGDTTTRFTVAQEWDLVADFGKGVVFATKRDRKRILPIPNIAYMIPLAEQPKTTKVA